MNRIKKIIALAALLLAIVTASPAQIFMTEDDLGPRFGAQDPDGVIPLNGVTWDQTNETSTYAPLGTGVFIMTAFGAAYLIKKKRKKS